MKFIAEHAGKRYRILFSHWDNRTVAVRDEEGRVVERLPQSPRAIRKHGVAQTACYIHEVEVDTEGKEVVINPPIAQSNVKCSPKDRFNRAHGRWYALERALKDIKDDRLRRALRKGYYAGTRWRPDGSDGWRIDRTYHNNPQLVEV